MHAFFPFNPIQISCKKIKKKGNSSELWIKTLSPKQKSLRATQHLSFPKQRQTNSNPLDLNRNQTETKNPTTKQKQIQSQLSQETEEEKEEVQV
jgi:hypothetical protein